MHEHTLSAASARLNAAILCYRALGEIVALNLEKSHLKRIQVKSIPQWTGGFLSLNIPEFFLDLFS